MQGTEVIHVLVVDDHPLVRETVRAILSTEPRIQVTGEVGDGFAAAGAARDLCPDAVILDVTMPRVGGFELARFFQGQYPHTRIIMLSVHADAAYVEEALQVGAAAYVIKERAASELVPAILAAVPQA